MSPMLRLRPPLLQMLLAVVFLLPLSLSCAWAQVVRTHPPASSAAEARTSTAFEHARAEGPLALRAFLHEMPKGGDLHNHLDGAVYAESWIRAAIEDGLCVDPVTDSFIHRDKNAPPSLHSPESCKDGTAAAATLPGNQHLFDELVDAFSMRTFVPVTGESGHDHFFNSFAKFSGTSHAHIPEWLDEVAARAAAQNEQYLELMRTPNIAPAVALAKQIGYQPDFVAYRQQMLNRGLRDQLPALREELAGYEAKQRELEHCGTPGAMPACQVMIRFLVQVLRDNPPESVFAQILLGFELADADPHVVGINLVQPEDAYYSMHDYNPHMVMIAALRPLYPHVKVTLHAGELAPGLVPPAGLTFHIRSAVEVARAERIGHGADIMYEDSPETLLREMAARHVAVEINLTSNDVILNLRGDTQPFLTYRRFGVPLVLSTDDEGVSRIDLTHEYQRAAGSYHLSYSDLKAIARNSIEYSFLPGASLWIGSSGAYTRIVDPCRVQMAANAAVGTCAAYLAVNPKAAQEWELEHRFRVFEEEQESAQISTGSSRSPVRKHGHALVH